MTVDRASVGQLHAEVWAELAGPGDWWDGAARVAAMAEARAASSCRLCSARLGAVSPNAVEGAHARVATDPARLTRRWAEGCIAELGDGAYAELVGVTALTVALDVYARAMGETSAGTGSAGPAPLPAPVPGEPARERPADVGDVAAWLPMTVDKALANVSRALSLVPRTNRTWRKLVNDSYSRGPQMLELRWQRALSRPQVELVAARVSALNGCFY
jgi:hypothetical protein